MMALLGFLVSAAVVIAAGVVLARAGDVIVARTSLGSVWVGTIFLAGATSLPELTTDIAAVRMGPPDLAAGDLFAQRAPDASPALRAISDTGRPHGESVGE